jgi:DHA1 family bicyclomycin/chloramphenicol resistance-like MFS transporter
MRTVEAEGTQSHLTGRYIALVALIATSTLSTLATDLYAPIQPHVATLLKASPEMVKLTVSLYFLAGSALYLFYGPLSERFGRRPILIGAMAIFALTSFASAFLTSVEQLIVVRVLQGAASGAETMLVLAIIRDYFVDREQVKAMSLYRAAVGVTPIFAPFLGVMLFQAYGWRANFLVVSTLSTIVVIALFLFLKESNRNKLEKLDLLHFGREYLSILTNLRFLLLAMIFVTSVGFFIIFHSAVPFVVNKELGLPAEMFAYLQAGFMLAFIAGNLIANRLMKVISVRMLLWLCLGVVAAANLVYWVILSQGAMTLMTLAVPILMLAFANGPIMSAVPTLAMGSTSASAGASSAVLLTIVSLLASGAAVIEGRIEAALQVPSSVSIAMTLSGLLVFAIICAALALRGEDAEAA